MKSIKPQPLRDHDWADMEAQLRSVFFEVIFQPMLDILLPHSAQVKAAMKEFKNADDGAVIKALRAGKIQYSNGVFSGDFNAAISRELKKMGASWNKQTRTFALAHNRLPPSVSAVAQQMLDATRRVHAELEKRLAEIEHDLINLVDRHPVDAVVTVGRVQEGFEKSAGAALGAESDLSESGKERLADMYSESLRPYIEDFSGKMVRELREAVQRNADEGYRSDKLISLIQGRYEVSLSKAKFLARQETSILVSKHRQVRFEEAGVTRYVWRTSEDSRVRDDHRDLDGREFLYSRPPIVDRATGRRGNPGQDFGCRCVDDPVLPGIGALV